MLIASLAVLLSVSAAGAYAAAVVARRARAVPAPAQTFAVPAHVPVEAVRILSLSHAATQAGKPASQERALVAGPGVSSARAARTVFARRPAWVMRLLHHPFVHSRNGGAPFVALTFDDGPHSVHTPEVLARLHRFRVSATFFLVGQRVAAAPHLVERLRAAGHTVGNHTFSHPRFGRFGFAGPRRELERCRELVPGATAFRPPFGLVTPGVWFAARRLGLPLVTWSVDSGDWQCRSEAEAIAAAQQVLDLVRPGDIVLLHDDRPWIGAILDVLLPGLAARGLLWPALGAAPERKRTGAATPVRSLACLKTR